MYDPSFHIISCIGNYFFIEKIFFKACRLSLTMLQPLSPFRALVSTKPRSRISAPVKMLTTKFNSVWTVNIRGISFLLQLVSTQHWHIAERTIHYQEIKCLEPILITHRTFYHRLVIRFSWKYMYTYVIRRHAQSVRLLQDKGLHGYSYKF